MFSSELNRDVYRLSLVDGLSPKYLDSLDLLVILNSFDLVILNSFDLLVLNSYDLLNLEDVNDELLALFLSLCLIGSLNNI